MKPITGLQKTHDMKILVVGCGGVGSEVIKLLQHHELTLIDYDRVELTNLNRQFYFLPSDCGRYKAEVIGEKLRCKYLVGRIEKIPVETISTFDAVIGCLDTIEGRMVLNSLFKESSCATLIDCGVEGNRLHVKKVSQQGSCLYCIRNIYNTALDLYYCSLASVPRRVDVGNRDRVLASIIAREIEKDRKGGEQTELGDSNSDIKEEIVDRCVLAFNEIAPESLQTDKFEVQGHIYKIVPSICYINSICASYAVLSLMESIPEDFIFYDGSWKDEIASRLVIEPYNEDCLVCEMAEKGKKTMLIDDSQKAKDSE